MELINEATNRFAEEKDYKLMVGLFLSISPHSLRLF